MSHTIDPGRLAKRARESGREISEEIASVHGRYWEARDALIKLVLSLSAAILAGTISFSENILGVSACPLAGSLLIASWFLFLVSICAGIASLWNGTTLHSFRVRFTNAEPAITAEAAAVKSNDPSDLLDKVLDILRKYSDLALQPLGKADLWAKRYAKTCLIAFALALGLFLLVGGIVVT